MKLRFLILFVLLQTTVRAGATCAPAALETLSISLGHPISEAKWIEYCGTSGEGTGLIDSIKAWQKHEPNTKIYLVFAGKGHSNDFKMLGIDPEDRAIKTGPQKTPYYYLWIGKRYGGPHAALLHFQYETDYVWLTSRLESGEGLVEQILLDDKFISQTYFIFEIVSK